MKATQGQKESGHNRGEGLLVLHKTADTLSALSVVYTVAQREKAPQTRTAFLGHGYSRIQVSETSTSPDAGPGWIRKDHAALQAEVQRECGDSAHCGFQCGDTGDGQEQPGTDCVGRRGPEKDEAPLEASLYRHSWSGVCGG